MEDQPENIGEIVESVIETVCKYCGGRCAVFRMEKGPHFAKLECTECHRLAKWISKPDSQKYKRPSAHRELVRKFGKGYCEMCLRKSEDLPGTQVLEGHHVDPYSKNRNRELTKSDVWILCTMCHSLVDHVRTYIGHYHDYRELPEDSGTAEGTKELGFVEDC